MAKNGYPIRFTAYSRRDPVKGGEPKTFLRMKGNIIRDPVLKNYNKCVANKMYGQTFNGARAVREAFANAASSCAPGKGGSRAVAR